MLSQVLQIKQYTIIDVDAHKGDGTAGIAGADPYEKDELPSAKLLQLSLEQLQERDLLIYDFLQDKGIPGAYLMAGGYGESSWEVYTQFLEWALLDNLE